MTRTIAGFQPGNFLIADQDLQLDEHGNLLIVDGLEDVRQRVLFRLRFWLGQWYLLGSRTACPTVPRYSSVRPPWASRQPSSPTRSRSLKEVTGVSNVCRDDRPGDPAHDLCRAR